MIKQISEELVTRAQADTATALQSMHHEEEEEPVGIASSSASPLLLRMTSRRRRTIVRQAVTSMTDAPLFVILDFRCCSS